MEHQVNVSAYLSIMLLFLGGITTYILWYYPNHKNFPYHVYPTIWLEYFCSIGIALLVPLDLTITIIGRKYPNYYDQNINTIINVYLVLYWITVILSNVVLFFSRNV